MGIFDFLKRKEKDKQEVVEKISFEQIKEHINEMKKKILKEQETPQKQIKENLLVFVKSLEKRKEVLQNLDLKDKKAPEHVKLIVKENFQNFIYHLEKLILDLKQLDEVFLDVCLEDLINKINTVFSEFEKKSLISFQKSTFLIGKELGYIKEDITKFFRLFNKIIKENNKSIEKIKIISNIEHKLKEIDDLKHIEFENNQIIENIKEKINDFKGKIQELEGEIENIKSTQTYIKNLKNKQEIEIKKTKLIIELQKLREMIDFKALAKVYHSIEDKMSMIKEYKENFKQSFEKYSLEDFLRLIDIKDINQESIKNKIKDIHELKEGIKNIKIEEDETENLEKEIKHIKEKIQEFHFEILGKERRKRKLQESKVKMKKEIVRMAEGVGVGISEIC